MCTFCCKALPISHVQSTEWFRSSRCCFDLPLQRKWINILSHLLTQQRYTSCSWAAIFYWEILFPKLTFQKLLRLLFVPLPVSYLSFCSHHVLFSLNYYFTCDTALVVVLQSRQMKTTVFPHLGSALYYQKCKIKLVRVISGKLTSHLIEFSICFKAVHYLSLVI